MSSLTPKQEAFALAFVETGNSSEAYRRAYNVRPTTSAETIWQSASRVLNDPRVSARVAELRVEHSKRHNVTVDSLIAELEEARQAALTAETPQASAATAATLGKAKLLGLDKQLVEVSGGMAVALNISFTK